MEMPEEDQPPEYIWKNDEALTDHFEQVRLRYRSKGGDDRMESVPDMMQNENTKGIRG